MSRFTSWFRGADVQSKGENGQDRSAEALMAEEISKLEDAFGAANLIMNDDMDGAEKRLAGGNDSSYHQLALCIIGFMRSILGAEKDSMAEASAQLATCEARALADLKRAQKDFIAYPNSRFPPGTEYSLVHSEALLMSAVVGALHESFTEGIKSLYKLRKAFLALASIMDMDTKALELPRPRKSISQTYEDDKMPGTFGDAEFTELDSSDDTEQEVQPQAAPPLSLEPVSGSGPDGSSPALDTVIKTNGVDTLSNGYHPDNPRDAFIHSGVSMCYGTLLFLFTMVPPSFSRVLNMIGFHGDRQQGIQMLWKSTVFPNIHGAVAALVLLSYYNGLLGFSDIVPTDEHFDESAEAVGLPAERCRELLATMRSRYPKSGLWKLEESRTLANKRNLSDAIKVIATPGDSNMRQIAALLAFELSLDSLFIQDWSLVGKSFLRCIELNDWSHALYYYAIGCAEVELYRDALHAKPPQPDKATQHKTAAEKMFRKVPGSAGKKMFMAKQLPFEVFVQRKVRRWEELAKELGVDFIDAIGVSPAGELSSLWNGLRRQNTEQLTRALELLDWSRCTAPNTTVERLQGMADEEAIYNLCRAPILRVLGRVQEARDIVEKKLLTLDRSVFKGSTKDDYVLPTAHYELAVIAWTEACPPEGFNVEKYEEEQAKLDEEKRVPVDQFVRSKVEECQASLDKVAQWEAFVLNNRLGIRIQSGFETLKWFRKKMKWTT